MWEEDENLEEERNKQRQEVYKRADLLKMHAYKDAIKRTQGAYILYPGNQNRIWREFEEVLPSVGAFAVRPGNSGEAIGLHDLSAGFLSEVLDYLELKFTGSTN
ncbi:nuclease domain-containing protein [Peribacillus sp. Bi134]|uniref:nuclease domain-containing protein n=1 Tax=Peribacillus sp. Bi134 TaxID=2884272 RepID=UPI0025B6B582|nr:nuclease domain-containing protein [Peribacillus sp. Bi134]